MRIAIPKNREQLKSHLRDPLFRNSYFLMANRITGAGAGFVFWLIAARCYTSHEVGMANAIISAMSLLALFSAVKRRVINGITHFSFGDKTFL